MWPHGAVHRLDERAVLLSNHNNAAGKSCSVSRPCSMLSQGVLVGGNGALGVDKALNGVLFTLGMRVVASPSHPCRCAAQQW